ncbi:MULTISPECIES: CBS domain-containing protein [unclassified Variovorax]|uniref:CBS domain-containing protein n=1 Tax=unclassified Variovorax TaxID=663243 RepID=UPI00131D648E|nr:MULTISPECIES: CBS domain-containing protein [unclassified Variovorax]QRY35248.1 CBS domain-containing protein [Variovorax sp. PDNC026]
MTIQSLCRREVVGISANAGLREAADLMCEQHVGSLVVVTNDTPPKVVGIVTDRDLALDGLGREQPRSDQPVGELVRGRPLAVSASADLRQAAEAMETAGVRRLLVVDDDGGVVGIVSADDLLEAMAQDLAKLAQALRRNVSRETSERGVFAAASRPRVTYPAFGTVASQ